MKGGLLLDSREGWMHGGNGGPVIVPGDPDASPLIQAVRYATDDLQMPPDGDRLTSAEVADLTEWVRRGAPDPRTTTAPGGRQYGGVGRAHWSFQPVVKPDVPDVRDAAWPRNPIDSFILARLEAAAMTPSPPADRTTLIRRIYFDLIGLPPSPAEVQAFLRDTSPDAYEKVVDRLLASPAYGEHWARMWLDVARYADTKGDPARQQDPRFPHAWTYRDWVIGAFNADMPYNQFVFAQLAGDAMQAAADRKAKEAGRPPPERHALAALGFLTLGNAFDGRRDDVIADQIDVTTKAFLGLTVACARCHDHKFDPIPTEDYYSLYGVFANSQVPAELPTFLAEVPATPEFAEYEQKKQALDEQAQALRQELQALRRERGRARLDPMQRREFIRRERTLEREMAELESTHPGAPARVNAIFDVRRPRDYPVLLRGEVRNRGEVVPRRFLEVLSSDPKARPAWRAGSGRVELARAIVDPANPLTARVLVNRIWQEHWGRGLVATPDDFGNMSAPPTHPELLDWLAATFVEDGWSIKQLHRRIVLSAAYQQASRNNPAHAERDPDNLLLWRHNVRRLDFEQAHDALLAICGELDLTLGGRPVDISSQDYSRRRAIYAFIDRRNPPELLTQFDFPSPDIPTGRRHETSVPQQALFLMNSPMVIEAARKLVDDPAFSALPSDDERIRALYFAVFQRPPTREEIELGLDYIRANPTGTAVEPNRPLTRVQEKARDQRIAARKKQKGRPPGGRFSPQIGGAFETRAPLDAWTKLAHALFQSNEAAFYR